jgi:hypothetical protein
VTSPHFHKYNREGRFLAYKTEKLKSEAEAKALCDIQFAFPCFCQETNILHKNDVPELEVKFNDLFSKISDDPLESIIFA